MDPYDSDSSGFEDEGDYTETGVVLGYASEEIIEDSVTHIGGWPVCWARPVKHLLKWPMLTRFNPDMD